MIEKVQRMNCGVDILTSERAKSAEDASKPPTTLLRGRAENNEYDILWRMYGTSVDAYEALVNYLSCMATSYRVISMPL